MNEDSSAYHDKLQKILDAQSIMTEIEGRKADGEEKRVNKVDDPQLMGEAKTAIHDTTSNVCQ